MASGIIPRHGPQPKGEENHPHMEEIVRIAAKPIAYIGATITVIGAFTLAMLCCGAALGVLLRRRTRN